jgi:hypothetical protein
MVGSGMMRLVWKSSASGFEDVVRGQACRERQVDLGLPGLRCGAAEFRVLSPKVCFNRFESRKEAEDCGIPSFRLLPPAD